MAKLKILFGIIADNFDIEENKSVFSPGDYYRTFMLDITSKDKKRIISEIESLLNFNKQRQLKVILTIELTTIPDQKE